MSPFQLGASESVEVERQRVQDKQPERGEPLNDTVIGSRALETKTRKQKTM